MRTLAAQAIIVSALTLAIARVLWAVDAYQRASRGDAAHGTVLAFSTRYAPVFELDLANALSVPVCRERCRLAEDR